MPLGQLEDDTRAAIQDQISILTSRQFDVVRTFNRETIEIHESRNRIPDLRKTSPIIPPADRDSSTLKAKPDPAVQGSSHYFVADQIL